MSSIRVYAMDSIVYPYDISIAIVCPCMIDYCMFIVSVQERHVSVRMIHKYLDRLIVR